MTKRADSLIDVTNDTGAVSDAIHRTMQSNKAKDTKPELVVRSLLREAGYPGYRLHWKKAPGKPDITYPGRKVAIFVNGCFWHRHLDCKYAYTPKTNQYFWINKFDENVERDRCNYLQLKADGWKVFIVWECELEIQEIEKELARHIIEKE